LSFEPPAFLLQMDIWELISHDVMVIVVLGILACFSVYSWTVILSKWQSLRGARTANARFLRAFRKSTGFEAVMVASEQFRPSPLVAVFDFGYEEVERQVKLRGNVSNRSAVERTVLGIISAFLGLAQSQGSASLKSVGPGIAAALITTAVGLGAAIPAAIFFNHFSHKIREMGARMDDFALEFLNMTERSFGE
jgi:biopolymer transport protein TolQ